jgi:hypothetical protein
MPLAARHRWRTHHNERNTVRPHEPPATEVDSTTISSALDRVAPLQHLASTCSQSGHDGPALTRQTGKKRERY